MINQEQAASSELAEAPLGPEEMDRDGPYLRRKPLIGRIVSKRQSVALMHHNRGGRNYGAAIKTKSSSN